MNLVDVEELKREITSFMSTGYQADEILCRDILKCIDRHTQPDKPHCYPAFLDEALNEGDGVYRP